MAPAFKPHVVLLDLLLPRLNGRQVAKRLCDNLHFKEAELIAVRDVVQDIVPVSWGQALFIT